MKALITGASSGIGKDMAKILASKGYNLAIVARNEDELKKVARELEEKNKIKVETIAIDLSNEESCIRKNFSIPLTACTVPKNRLLFRQINLQKIWKSWKNVSVHDLNGA